MSACGSGKKTGNASTDDSLTTGSNPLTNSGEQSSVGSDSKDDSKETDNDTVNKNEQLDASNFKETTVVDNDKCSIKLVSMRPDYDGTYIFDVSLENKSDTTKYMYYATDTVINGVQCTPMMSQSVDPGKTEQTELRFSGLYLPHDSNGALDTKIDFSDIRITFRVQDFNDGLAKPTVNETVKIYPFGEDKANTYIRHSQMTDRVIMANDDVTVSIIGYTYNTDWSYAAELYIQNHTDKPAMLSAEDCYINGLHVDPYFALTVLPNSSVFNSVEWNVEGLKKLGINKIDKIEMVLLTYDENYNIIKKEDVFIDTSSIEFKVHTDN